MKWIRDEEFIRDKVPMTKFDIRLAVIAALSIDEDDVFLDVGAGTGSISIQAALAGALVYSIEKKEKAVDLIGKNAEKFKTNINLLRGEAPEVLNSVPDFNKCFIGGSGGKLKEIFEAVNKKIKSSGIVAASFITLKNVNDFYEILKTYNYLNIEVKLLQVSILDKLGLMKANNPVFLVRGIKSVKKLYGIGVGPGDAEYLTIKGYKAIKRASAVFVPNREGESTALSIVKDYVDKGKITPINIVMGENNDIRYSQAAKVIEETLDDGETGVFLTIGDPMVYSTFLYLMRELEKIKVHVEAVPGISSFTAAASKVKIPIAMKGEGFYLCDGVIDEEVLKKCSSIAVLKTYKNKKDILSILEKHGFEYVYVKCCGRADEKILYEAEEILKDKSYMSLLLGRRKVND